MKYIIINSFDVHFYHMIAESANVSKHARIMPLFEKKTDVQPKDC